MSPASHTVVCRHEFTAKVSTEGRFFPSGCSRVRTRNCLSSRARPISAGAIRASGVRILNCAVWREHPYFVFVLTPAQQGSASRREVRRQNPASPSDASQRYRRGQPRSLPEDPLPQVQRSALGGAFDESSNGPFRLPELTAVVRTVAIESSWVPILQQFERRAMNSIKMR
jgi:hypothetical protein